MREIGLSAFYAAVGVLGLVASLGDRSLFERAWQFPTAIGISIVVLWVGVSGVVHMLALWRRGGVSLTQSDLLVSDWRGHVTTIPLDAVIAVTRRHGASGRESRRQWWVTWRDPVSGRRRVAWFPAGLLPPAFREELLATVVALAGTAAGEDGDDTAPGLRA